LIRELLRRWFGRRKREPTLLQTLEDGWPASKRQNFSRVKINEYLPALQTKAVVLNDRHGVLCASYWMQINTSCRPYIAPTPGLEHGVTQRNFYHSLVQKDSVSETPATTTPAAEARPSGSTGTAYE
jgi:hypothetical protein